MELFPIGRLDAYSYVLFQIKDSSFAISCEYVSDVQPVPGNVSQPPKAARYISGISNSFGRVITILIACRTTAKGFGGKKDYSNPEFRILMASRTGSPLRSMQISEGMKYGLMQGILEMASGHFLKGILKMIRGLLGRLGGQKTRLVLDRSSHFIFI